MKRSKYGGYIALGVTAFLVAAAALLLFFTLFHFSAIRQVIAVILRILRPVFYGMILAFLLLPIHRRTYAFLTGLFPRQEKFWGLLNLLAIILSILFLLFIFYILLAMLVSQVYPSIVNLVQSTPGYIRSIQDWITTYLADNPDVEAAVLPYYNAAANYLQERLQSDVMPNLESISSTVEWIRSTILPNLSSVATNVSAFVAGLVSLLKDLLIAVIVSIYLLLRKDVLAAQTKKIVYSIFPTKWGDLIVEETRGAYHILSGFINGKLLDSLIIGVICFVVCSLLKLPYAALVSTIVGVTNIIPFFGPFIGAIPSAFLILLVSPIQCVYFILFILVLQQFDGNLLGPKILGGSTGLDAFWVLFSILLFGGLFGVAGMVLGVPVFAMIYSTVSRLTRYALRKRGLPESTDQYMGKTEPMAVIPDEGEFIQYESKGKSQTD